MAALRDARRRGGVAFVVGLVVGLPALRIQGLYLALVTLALATLFPLVITRFSELTGGSQGKSVPVKERFRAPDVDEPHRTTSGSTTSSSRSRSSPSYSFAT